MNKLAFEMDRNCLPVGKKDFAFRRLGKDNLAALEKLWCDLASENGGPIEQHEWAVACAEFTNAAEVETVGVMRGSELSAVVPLAIKRLAGVKRRVMLGVDEYFEPMNFLAADAESLDRLIQELAADPRPLLLPRLPTEPDGFTLLKSAFEDRSIIIERPGPSSPFIPLDATWREPERHLSAGRRSDFRRMRRHLENLGHADTEIVIADPERIDAVLNEAFQVEARSWKGIAGTALLHDKKRQAHFRKYLRAKARVGKCHIGFLRVNGQAIAMEIAVEEMASLWILKIGYDAAFAHCSPGQLLLRDMIAHAAKIDLKSFEFLGTCEPWIDIWTSHRRNFRSVRIYPYSVPGVLGFTADAFARSAQVVRQTVKRIHPVVRQYLIRALNCGAKSYIPGGALASALKTAEKFAQDGISATIGYWNTELQTPEEVAAQGMSGFKQLAQCDQRSYLSVKLPALRFDKELISKLAVAAINAARRIHFDSHGIEYVIRNKAICEDLKRQHPDLDIGFTLPGRWERSVEDAAWCCRQGFFVRVVKGQWPDPGRADADAVQGFLRVIESLAGRARMVAVATHDPALADSALRTLRLAGTPCELELLHGSHKHDSLQVARRLGVPVRVYIPYGEGFLLHALLHLRSSPRTIWSFIRV